MLHPVLFIDALDYFVGDRRKYIVLSGYTASATRSDCTFDGYPLQFYYIGADMLPYRCMDARHVTVLPTETEIFNGWTTLNREATIYSMFEFENDDWSIMEMIFEYCDHYNEEYLTSYIKNKGNFEYYNRYLELLEDSRTMYAD